MTRKEELKKSIEKMKEELASMEEELNKPEKIEWNSDDIFVAERGGYTHIMTFTNRRSNGVYTFSSLGSTYERFDEKDDPQELLDFMVDWGGNIHIFKTKTGALEFMLEKERLRQK